MKKPIIIEYPSWNPYAIPTIGNLRGYFIGRALRQILKTDKIKKIDTEYLFNDTCYPSIKKEIEQLTIEEKAIFNFSSVTTIVFPETINKLLAKIGYDNFSIIHEKDLWRTIPSILVVLAVKKLLVSEELAKKVKTKFNYSSEEFLINSKGVPLYLLSDLCYSFSRMTNAELVISIIGEDQKKHVSSLITLNKVLGVNNRHIVLNGLVYKGSQKGENKKFSKREGDYIEEGWLDVEKRNLSLFFLNRKFDIPIFNFDAEYLSWKIKNRKVLSELKLINKKGVRVETRGFSSSLLGDLKNEIIEKKNTSVSKLVDYLFKLTLLKIKGSPLFNQNDYDILEEILII
jgi:arginyl-tRNA synthetase